MKKHKVFTVLISTGLLCISALLFSACGGTSKANTTANTNANARPTTVDVTTAQATVQNMPTYFEATGNLVSDAQTDVAPTVGGKIVEVNFDIGTYVEKGSVLVRLDARDAQIKLEQAQAQVDQQKQTVVQAEANVNQAIANLRQTQAKLGVKDGEGYNVENYPQVKNLKAQLELAERELTRTTRLLESGDVSRSAYDQRKSQRDSLVGQVDDARSTAAVAVKTIDTARAQVDTAQTNVGNAKAAVATAQTQVDQAKKAITDTTVLAPISGYIAERVADLGEFAATNAKLATIVRTSVLRMRIDVPEQAIGQIKVGQGAALQTSTYPDRNFNGTITRISPSLNATSRSLIVEAEVENVGGLLKPGQFATVRITQSSSRPAVMVPTAAIKTEGDTSKIFVIKDGRANERTVKVGALEGEKIEVQQGLAEGEQVATSNLNVVYDGVQVNGK